MLKEQLEWDERNVVATTKFLEFEYPDCTKFFDDLDGQFEKLKSLIPPKTYTKSEQVKAWLLMDCQRQLALMSTTFLRGHITDSFGNARRAVELVATIGRILRDETEAIAALVVPQPGSAVSASMSMQPSASATLTVSKSAAKKLKQAANRAAAKAAKRAAKKDLTTLWFESSSPEGLEAYKNEAKITNLWNNNLATTTSLQEKYSLACKMVHTGAYSIISSIPKNSDGSLVLDKFKPHQLSEDGTELMISFLFLIDCFIQVLEGLAETYDVHTDPGWMISINAWRGKRDLIRNSFEPKLKSLGAI